jgi:lipopolysaccharide transport system permease protein
LQGTVDKPQQDENVPYLRIEPSKGWVNLNLKEVWEYRELLYFLIWRDVKVRYKQTVIGAGWAIIQPLMTMLVFTVIFGGLANIPSDGVWYPIFSYTALVPWTFFAGGLSKSSNSLVGSANLLKKVYFPRLIIPIANVVSGLVDFVLAFSILIVMMILPGILFPETMDVIVPTANIIWLPAFLLLALATSLGVGLWMSALNVQFRDVRYVVPFLVQILTYATPIAWPSSLADGRWWQPLIGLNPMAGVVEGFRWALLGSAMDDVSAPGPIILISVAVAVILLVSGAFFFKRMEKTFADVV